MTPPRYVMESLIFRDLITEIGDHVKGFCYPRGVTDDRGTRTPAPVSLPQAALGRLRVALEETFAQASRESGLSAQQAELLCAAMMRPGAIGDLARVLHCDRSNVSRLVDRAARRGLVYRRGGDSDGASRPPSTRSAPSPRRSRTQPPNRHPPRLQPIARPTSPPPAHGSLADGREIARRDPADTPAEGAAQRIRLQVGGQQNPGR